MLHPNHVCFLLFLKKKKWFKCSSYAEIKIPSNASIYFSGCYIMIVLSHNKAQIVTHDKQK